MNTLVIEPHADDAFLSLGEHLAAGAFGKEVGIVTAIPESERRADEARSYAATVGAFWTSLDLSPGASAEAIVSAGRRVLRGGPRPTRIIAPLGIEHPEHEAVAEGARQLAMSLRVVLWQYVDVPYCKKLKNVGQLNSLLRRRVIVSMLYPSANKVRKAAVFKSQAKFFYFNPPSVVCRIPELILGKEVRQ